MSSSRADVRWSPSSSSLPADHVLTSAAVIFPGVFDQHGCPLFMFPAETQCKLSEDISREDVSQFIHYCLRLHNKKGEEGLVSVVADLRQADGNIVRFITETLQMLELCRRMIHSVYIVQPKKKSVQKQLGKLLTASSKHNRSVLFNRVFLKDVCELSNYIDRSQLTCSLGGYLIYCHDSWVAFIKEIDAFVQEFVCVVNRLPSCISTLQSLAKQPVPADYEQLREFCSVNEARFHQLRRDLGLDDLLKRCECLLEKLRFPENEPCFHAMAGTVLFAHTALEMLQNYNRLSAAVEKVELLWQQAFSKARLQLQVTHLRRDAQQIQKEIIVLHREKVQPYRIQQPEDVHRAESLWLEFEISVYTHAMALVRRADDVIHTFAETVPLTDVQNRESWVDDLHRMKENLSSAVQHLYRNLRNTSDFHYNLNRCKDWYNLVLCQSFLLDVLRSDGLCESSFTPNMLIWRRVQTFLRMNPAPKVQELELMTRLANVITDPNLQNTGKQLSHRCMTLKRLLTSPGSVPVHDLQLVLQWQYEYFTGNHKTSDITSSETGQNKGRLRDSGCVSNSVPHRHSLSQCESLFDLAKWPSVGDCYHPVSTAGVASAEGKPPSLSSFDSGFDGAGSGHLDTRSRRDGLPKFPGNGNSKPVYAQIHEENITSVSDSEEFSLKRDNTQASIQIVPKITSDSVNLEIKVKRSATLPKNPWLSLPIDDLESSYTVTITPNSSGRQRRMNSPGLSVHSPHADQSEQHAQTHDVGCVNKSSVLHSRDVFEDSDLNPIINVLSSTITDHEDKANMTAEAEASLLWDTFDLHNLRQETCERLDVGDIGEMSLCDWIEREQQALEEVEKTLDRAAEILQEEENVLAQEMMINDLLETEDVKKHWNLWNDEDQHDVMSPQDLVKSGVVGLDDVSSLPISPHSELISPETNEICETHSGSSGLVSESLRCMNGLVQQKVDVLQQLQDLQVLEEQILEESLKLEALRVSEAEELLSEPTPHATTRSSCRESRMILSEEKQDIKSMERSLRRERMKRSGYRVVRCSVMERDSMLNDLKASEESSSPETSCTDMRISTSETPQNQVEKKDCSLKECKSERLRSAAALNSTSRSEIDHGESVMMGILSPVLVHPVRSSVCLEVEISSCVDDADTINDHLINCQTETADHVSSIQKINPEQGAFDPGGAVTLVPPSSDGTQTQNHVLPSSESVSYDDLIQIPKVFTNLLQGRSLQGLHMQNNNNNKNGLQSPLYDRSTIKPNREAEADHKDLNVKAESVEVTGEQNERGVSHDGGGSMRAVCRSLLEHLPTDTSSRLNPLGYKTPIVLDTGSGLMKAGFADQDLPMSVFPTVIGHPKYEEVMSGGVDRELYVGHDAQHMRGVLTLKHPIRNGVVRSWDEMEMIWHHAFQQLAVDPRDHPVLLTEAAMNPVENRQRMVELMFETFNVPLTFVAMQAVLALYASGRTTGVVLDSGDGVSHSVPVFEGYSLLHAVQRFCLAGADVTLQLQKLLLEQGVCMQTSAELEIVREIKEKCCCVALDYESELKSRSTASSEVQYTLPDGRIISLCTERFRAPEVLFKPELIGRDHYGMHESIFKSILQSDIDLRRRFVGNILLSGGNTLLAGLPERLQMEISRMVPVDLMESVRVTSPSDRDFSVWCGGAVMANLPVFSSAWISADEYEEFGPQIVFRKCF